MAGFSLFGYTIGKDSDQDTQKKLKDQGKSFVPPTSDDGTLSIAASGYYGQYVDIDGDAAKTDVDLIKKYRISAEQPECDSAIEDIVNEAIVSDEDASPVSLNLDNLEADTSVKDAIRDEFDEILKLLDFSFGGHEIFRRWYVDGRLYYHMIIDENNQEAGIKELRLVDSLKMRKVREVKEEMDPKTGVKLIKEVSEYFVYQEAGLQRADIGLKISKDAVVYTPSGLLDPTRKRVLSPLQKALKPVNQLRMMEDSLVIYRLSRAPERRIFYIDVGNLPKGKAEEYMRNIMNQYRNKVVYDSVSGEIRNDQKHMSMLEDFWLPRRGASGRGTEISTLPSGDSLDKIADVDFFKQKLYRSLNVPVSRLESNASFSLGKSSEISRDELKFQKFVDRLRKRFSCLFLDLLKTQLILKKVIVEEDWDEIREKITVDYAKDSHFTELKDAEIMTERMALLTQIVPYIGRYYSDSWVRKNVLRQTDAEIEKINLEISNEMALNQIDKVVDKGPIDPDAEPDNDDQQV